MRWTTVRLPPERRPPWLDRDLRLPFPDGEDAPPELLGERVLRDADRWLACLREERWAGEMRSPTDWLPFSYDRLPGWLRLLAARALHWPTRRRRARRDPPWPVAAAADALLHATGGLPQDPWPGARWALALSHDVDGVHGLRCAPAIAGRVEAAGFRSAFFVVAEAGGREPAILRELRDRGHEIGSHDVRHDNRICRLPDAALDERLRRARAAVEPYGGTGFRSPSLLRSARLVERVGRHFAYDSSLCDTDLEHTRGCTTVFPYRLRGCLELPITLPMDSSLAYVGVGPERMVAVWKEKCAWLRAVGGLGMLVTHAEPHLSGRGPRLDALQAFLEWLATQDDCRVLRPGDVARLPAFSPGSGAA